MTAEQISTKKRRMIFFSLVMSCVFTSFLTTAMTTALPSVIADLGISVTTGQWFTSGYSLAMGMIMPLTAYLITRFSSKKLYLISIAMFITGSLLCVVTESFAVIMTGRILQALANGIIMSLTQVVLLTIYPKEKRGTIMGWYGLAVMTAPVLAPTIAGIIVDALGWKWIFYIIIVVMLASLIFAAVVFENVLDTKISRFDMLSFILSVITFGGLTLGIGNISSAGMKSPITIGMLAAGIIGGAFFIRRQMSESEPFLELRILKNHTFFLAVLGSVLLYFAMMGSSIIMPLYVQNVLGLSAMTSGLVTLPGSLASALSSPLAGKMYDRMGMRRLFILGSILLTVSNLGMCMISMSTPVLVASILNVVRCIAISSLMMPMVTWGIGALNSPSMNAHGTALLTALRTVAGAIGAAVFVGIMTNATQSAKASYGANAPMHGLHVAFYGMTAVAVILLLVGAVFVRDKNQRS